MWLTQTNHCLNSGGELLMLLSSRWLLFNRHSRSFNLTAVDATAPRHCSTISCRTISVLQSIKQLTHKSINQCINQSTITLSNT